MTTYQDETKDLYISKFRKVLDELPGYCKYFFNAKAQVYEARTRYAYAIDLRTFFEYIIQRNPTYKGIPIKDIPLALFNELNSHDIDEYMEFIESYSVKGDHRKNKDTSKSRKLASLKAFCKYMLRQGYIEKNPADLVESPKAHKNDIIILTQEEKKELLFAIKSGYGMTNWQDTVNQYCRTRDYAILMLLLGTGIRVSELVGLNLEDIDYRENKANIIRKGGSADHVYFSDQVKEALIKYVKPSIISIGTRESLNPPPELKALFVSRKKTRLSVRGVQKIIEKYKKIAFKDSPNKKITCHSMRRTYGTELYLKTNDIKLVSDTLGHASITTTQQHYAATTEEHKKAAKMDVI